MENTKKSEWLSAVLNFLFWGAGYIYNGKRVILGLTILVGYILLDFSSYIIIGESVSDTEAILVVAMIILGLAFAYDAYKEAKEINKGK